MDKYRFHNECELFTSNNNKFSKACVILFDVKIFNLIKSDRQLTLIVKSIFIHNSILPNKNWSRCYLACSNINNDQLLNWPTSLDIYNIWFLIFWCLTPLSAIFQLYHDQFSGGRSRTTRREPPTMVKQFVNFITCGCESSSKST
jgi:hypothetical protein